MICPDARVINMDRSTDRLATVAARLDAAGIGWQRQPAVAPASAEAARIHPLYRPQRAHALLDRDLRTGEIGCFLSHYETLRACLDGGAPLALVLEDDTVPLPGARTALDALAGWLAQGPGVPVGVIHLSRRVTGWSRPLATVGPLELRRAYRLPLISSAMLWTRAGMQEFVAHVQGNGIDRPVDDAFRACFCRSGRGTALDSPIFAEDDGPSTIAHHSSRFARETPRARLRRKLPDYLGAAANMLCRR